MRFGKLYVCLMTSDRKVKLANSFVPLFLYVLIAIGTVHTKLASISFPARPFCVTSGLTSVRKKTEVLQETK